MFNKLTAKIEKWLVIALLIGAVTAIGLFFYGRWQETLEALLLFKLALVPIIISLTLLNYLGRFYRWQYYLSRLKIKIPVKLNLQIFLAGLAMTITPGKTGELLKAYLVKKKTGVDFAKAAPAVICERLTDSLGMLFLMSWGLFRFRHGLLAVGLAAGVIVVFLFLIHQQWFFELLYKKMKKHSFFKNFINHLKNFHQSSQQLLGFSVLLKGTLMAIVIWSFEAIGFFLILVGLGIRPSLFLLTSTAFIFTFASFIGFVSMLPGGLIAAEVTKAGLLTLFLGLSRTQAAAATLLIRIFTLWFGVSLGTISLFTLSRKDLIE